MKDVHGREYASVYDLKAGDTVTFDDDFNCGLNSQETRKVFQDGGLYVLCKEGRHYLSGLKNKTYYIGIYKLEPTT